MTMHTLRTVGGDKSFPIVAKEQISGYVAIEKTLSLSWTLLAVMGRSVGIIIFEQI